MPRNAGREAVQKLKFHARTSGIFANLEAIGSYHDFSQLVFLDYLDEESFLQLLQSFQSNTEGDRNAQKAALQANYESMARFYSTCVHEFTHWLDHTSTLWGQKQLVLIYNAINAWTNQNEQEFYRIAIANSERQRARLAIYYTEKYKTDQQQASVTRWQYEYGSGLEFGIDGRPRADRPFVFTIFSNSRSERIIRVPFSMFALTEANATYAELKVKSQSLTLLDENFRLVGQRRLEQEIQQNLYNSELAIYSVATHCLANSVEIDECFRAYEFSSALATLCLNLSQNVFYSLSVPDEFNVWGDRVHALQELVDPGFAFFVIAKQAPKVKNEVSIEQWLEEALSNAKLPNLETIKSSAVAQMRELDSEILEGDHADQLRSLLSVGRANFVQRGIWGQNVLSMETLNKTSIMLPPIVLGDGYITPVVATTIPTSSQALQQWIEQTAKIEVSIDKFIRACRL
ncbi:MAG: hypothetical protein HC895_16585 [Leptolyngbyaceae cyanobacterium SM1_3_5]|nr:hypothetical protein [Leptolyngbyaceae cyanobacterium SM1_3_5]